jgi:titin
MKRITALFGIICFTAVAAYIPSAYAQFVVTSWGDDTAPPYTAGEFRWAINQANTTPGADTVTFNILTAPYVISLNSPLMDITDEVWIDGSSQPGAPLIEIDGSAAGAADGLYFTDALPSASSDNSRVTQLAVHGFTGNGIVLDGGTGVTLDGNRLGTDWADTPGLGNTGYGVYIQNGAAANTIGGTAAVERNVISGNGGGIAINGSTDTTVEGNYIGTDSTGTVARGNSGWGIYIWNSATGNEIGGDTAGERNVISGNGGGVGIQDSDGNTVNGNYIGIDVTGAVALGNTGQGVYLQNANTNTIGGPDPGEGNVISANGNPSPLKAGIELAGTSGANTDNVIQGNYIGTDATGTVALGNASFGIFLYRNNHNNSIADNLISGNSSHGVWIYETPGLTSTGNTVTGNYIGTDVTGLVDLGNGSNGVSIDGQPAA